MLYKIGYCSSMSYYSTGPRDSVQGLYLNNRAVMECRLEDTVMLSIVYSGLKFAKAGETFSVRPTTVSQDVWFFNCIVFTEKYHHF